MRVDEGDGIKMEGTRAGGTSVRQTMKYRRIYGWETKNGQVAIKIERRQKIIIGRDGTAQRRVSVQKMDILVSKREKMF